MTHTVAVLAVPGIAPFELSVVIEVFGKRRPELEPQWDYEVRVCTDVATSRQGDCNIRVKRPMR